jgi:AcrR family transcriptional regulator
MERGEDLSIRIRMEHAGMVSRAATRPQPSGADGRFTAGDWEAAALDAIAEHGVAGVSVEPIARRLGVTKGSFYWHFADRDALLAAALRRWEDSYTDRIIAGIAGVRDPGARLRALVRGVIGGGRSDRIHVALAASGLPLVRETLARVTERRIAYLESCYAELGQPPRDAKRSALHAYTTYVGLVHLRLEAPTALPTEKAFATYVDQLVDQLVPLWQRRSPATS